MSFAENLRTMRKHRGLTQEQLAKLAGISCSAIINYENGRRKDIRKSVIDKLNHVLNYPEAFFAENVELFSDGTIIGIRAKEEETRFFKPVQTITQNETNRAQEIHNYLNKLNDNGQQEAVRQVSLLTKIPEYQRNPEEHNT